MYGETLSEAVDDVSSFVAFSSDEFCMKALRISDYLFVHEIKYEYLR